ncbi:hypothetical protein Salat_0509400 [Sesamum alatum]|uniref:Uncharacterized protein n=1 Tax=Sesamum alatum TaxID=300844 RepID=A0AAE1Z3Y6_9LAMI|nr:hypothetical protein Salat_0509400 [Sesamum alatum]
MPVLILWALPIIMTKSPTSPGLPFLRLCPLGNVLLLRELPEPKVVPLRPSRSLRSTVHSRPSKAPEDRADPYFPIRQCSTRQKQEGRRERERGASVSDLHGRDAFRHLPPETIIPETIDKFGHRLGICYKRLAHAQEEINSAFKLNTHLPPNEVPFVPDWQVSTTSSVFNNKAGEVYFEMYKACLLPQDQIFLGSLHHARPEMLGAHLHHQCSYWRYDRDDIQAWEIKGLIAKKSQAQQKASDAQRSCKALKSEVQSLRSVIEVLRSSENKAFESGKGLGEK